MALSKAPRLLPRDKLRAKLDRLASSVVDEVTKPDTAATIHQKISALKVAGAYWAMSRKTDDPTKPETAWDKYAANMYGNGKDEDASEDEPAGRA